MVQTGSQWDRFLSQQSLLPKQLARPVLHIDYGHTFAFDDRRVAFSYGPELQKIDQDSRLRLDFGFVPDAGGAVLDIAGIAAYNSEEKAETRVFRHGVPADGASEDAKKEWNKRLRHDHPYDAVARPVPEVLYTFQYRAENGTPQDAMKASSTC